MTGIEGVVAALGQALNKRGYDVLTPVQEAVLAPELGDADVLVSAQTGSGKTVAFGIAIAPNLLAGADRMPRVDAPLALVVAPTRELALQVKLELAWLYEPTGASVASCVGGMDMRDERRALQHGAQIVVGTPGRLRDHIERGSLDMTGLRAVILDEADEMLDLGFREDLEYILDAAPADRRTLMFSATVPHSITGLARRYQRDAVRISTNADQKQHVDIDYRALTVAPNDRENAIVNVLRHVEAKNALVFCATRATVNHMTSRFTNRGFSVVALSGELSQNQRSHALQALRDGRARVCIATDVAARGIDLPNLELVIHADLPKNREGLLHRSGRTGRAGRKGVSVLIVPHNARNRTERLLKSANVTAEWARPPTIEDIVQRDRDRLFEDPALHESPTEDEMAFATDLLSKHGPEQIATAFLRLYNKGQTAPEELLDTAPPEPQKKRRDDFKNGVWFSLSVGRKQNAEPRWLVPMLCRAGHLTKGDIGAIKIRPEETHVELHPNCVDKFLAAVGPTRLVEDGISAKPLSGPPPSESSSGDGPAGRKPQAAKKTYEGRKPRENDRSSRKPESARTSSGPDAVAIEKQRFARVARKSSGDDPSEARPDKGKSDAPSEPRPYKGKRDAPGEARPYEGKRDAPSEARPYKGKRDDPSEARPYKGKRDDPSGARPHKGKRDAPGEARPYKGKRDDLSETRPYKGKRDAPSEARLYKGKRDVSSEAKPFRAKGDDSSEARTFKGKKDKTTKKPVGKKGRKPLSARKRSDSTSPKAGAGGGAEGAGFAPRKRKKPGKKSD